MSDGKKLGFLYSLQRLFRLGTDKPKPSLAPPPKKKRPSNAPKHKPSGQGSAKKESPRDKPAKKEPLLGAKKVTAKPKLGTTPKGPPLAAPAEAPGEIPPHERPAADRQRRSSEEKAAPSVYTPATPENSDRKIEPGAKSAPPPAAPAAAPGESPPEDVPSAERKTGKPGASSKSPAS